MSRLAALCLAVPIVVHIIGGLVACEAATPTTTPPTPSTTTAPKAALPTTVTLHGEGFAGPWQVEIDVVNERQRALAPTLQAAVVAAFDEVARQGDPRDPQSELQRLSSARHLRPLAASKGAAHLVRTALDVNAASNGAFAFTRGSGHVRIVDGAIVKDSAELELDLSPLLPGAAVDAVTRLLDERGFGAFRITVGSVAVTSTAAARTARATSSTCAVTGSDAVVAAALAPTCATLGIAATTTILTTSFPGYEATTP